MTKQSDNEKQTMPNSNSLVKLCDKLRATPEECCNEAADTIEVLREASELALSFLYALPDQPSGSVMEAAHLEARMALRAAITRKCRLESYIVN